MKKAIIILALSWLSPLCGMAVVVFGGDGTGNVTAPEGDERGWSYVGRISNKPSSVTYLGNQWFITANHIKVRDTPTSVLLNGQTYNIDPAKWTRITNSTGTDADLMMFRVNETVGLANLTVSSSTPETGTAVTMIGNGFDRHPDLISVTLGPGPDDYELLYQLKSGWENTSKRWGDNTISGDYYLNGGFVDTGTLEDPDLFGTTAAFYTDFSPYVGEAQAVTYDSGGGVFAGSGGSLELAGIMISAGYTGYIIDGTNSVMLTGGSAVYNGSETYIADLSAYSDQINQVIPEPATALLLVGVAALLGVGHRIRCMME